MANALQLRRGTTTQHSTFTGLAGEVTVDTDKETIVVHDGSTAGGFPLALESDITAASLLTAIKTVDGAGSGLDADLLDGQTGTYYTNYADTAVANLVASAPSTLDTLNELAAALGDDPNFATTVTNSIATKLDSSSYTAADVLTKIKTVDGSGSGLDADTVDGIQASSFLRSDVADSTASTISFTGDIEVGDQIFHHGDTDTYMQFNSANSWRVVTANTQRMQVNTTGVQLGDTGNGYFQPVSGDYGSIQIDGGAHGGYEGYSIGGRAGFLHNNSTETGISDDVNNYWLARFTHGGAAELFHNGTSKLQTTSNGVNISGKMTSTSATINGFLDIEEVFEKVSTNTTTSGTYSEAVTGGGVYYLTNNQTANRTVNFTGVNSALSNGQSVTVTVLSTQGSTAYYFNGYQVDSSSVTPKWSGGEAPTAGNASGIDVYTFTIIKTANATFTVLASVTQYA